MGSIEPNTGEPIPTDKAYTEIIKSEVEVDKKFIDEDGLPTKIAYFCLNCKKQVQPKRINRKFKFSCSECKGKSVSFGSETAIQNYYKDAHKK